jgi:hypothetical protein
MLNITTTTTTIGDIMRQFMHLYNTPNITTDVWVEEYDTLADLLAYARSNKKRLSSDKRGNGDWAGSDSLDDACDLGTRGWHEIRPEVDKLINSLDNVISATFGNMFETKFNITGDSGDIDRYLVGDPECMIDYVDVPQTRMGRVVRLLINGTVNATVSAETIRQRGAMVCSLVDIINRLGIGVEVFSEIATRSGGKYHSMLTKLHDSQQLLDIDNLMFAIAHPSMLRRVSFSNMEMSKWGEAKKIIGAGYGSASNCTLKSHVDADVVIDNFESGTGDFEKDGMKFIMSTITGLGLI